MKDDLRCWLYTRVDGKTKGIIFTGQDAIDKAMAEGWKTTPAAFLDEVEGITENERAVAEDIISIYDCDANLLANVDKIEDLSHIKEAYKRINGGKPMHHKVKTLEGARKAVKKLLGDSNGNSSDVH